MSPPSGFPRPNSPLPTPDPVSFAAQLVDASEVEITDPEHVARTLNIYAAVLALYGLSAAVAELDAVTP